MRPDRRDRRVARRREEPDERHEREAASIPSAVLALQRSAGNAAVGGWLRGAGGGLLQRDARKLPAEPHTLADVAPAAKDITIDTDELDLGNIGQWFKGPRGPDREGVAVEVRFAADMAAQSTDPKVEKKLRDGLASIAVAAFKLQSGSKGEPAVDLVRFRDLDLTPWGGKDGRYRFTSVARKTVTKGGSQSPSEVDVIVELMGPRRGELKPWKSLSADRRLDLQNRFALAGYTQAQPTLTTTVDTWTDDQFGMVLQALEYVPESMLRTVPGIVWERGHGKVGPNGEGGYFNYHGNPLERRLVIYDDAFGSDDALIKLIAHEMGHAISDKPPSEKAGASALSQSAGFQKAANDDGKPITAYAKKNWEEHYAEAYSMFIAEPDTMKALRPKLFAWFTAQQQAADTKKTPAVPAGAKP